jgi:hypothetical protein
VNQELQTYYNNYFNLFLTDGWKQLVEDFGNNAVQINSVEATKDSEDLHFRKGQLNVLTNYEEASKEPEEND